jgi:ABC-2 type transport system permease protein
LKGKGGIKKKVLVALTLVMLVNVASYFFHKGIDLTSEKRFTISDSTRELLTKIEKPLTLTVFLKGEMPAGFKLLAGATEDMANSFKSLSGGKFQIEFVRPGEGLDDSARAYLFDSLQAMGINPTNVKAQVKQGEQLEETLLFPGAILSSGERQLGMDFLAGQSNTNGIQSLNNAEALLEFKIAKAIVKIQQDTFPLVGYLTGNGEPLDFSVYDLIEGVIRPNYGFQVLPIDSVDYIPSIFKAIIIVKPSIVFSASQKLKIDQYIMRGGNVIWAIDNVYASMDSLQRSSGSFVAFDRGLNLDDQLFTYGIRINRDLVQDLESDKVPSVIGSIGDKPQIELLPWPYSPLLRNTSGHPISKNLDYVLSSFPQSIDTIVVDGIHHENLLTTSDYSRSLQSPAVVEWRSIKNEEDLRNFSIKNIPVVTLSTGKFKSVFKNRLTTAQLDSMKAMGMEFKPVSSSESQLIFLSDADILLNAFIESDGPLAMGMNSYTREQFANKDFIGNCLFFLTGGDNIMEARAKTFQLRLLDKEKLENERSTWQFIAVLSPFIFPLIIGLLFPFLRKRRFTRLS